MQTSFKSRVILFIACANSVMAAPILSEGRVGVTQETTIGRSLAVLFPLPAASGQSGVRLVIQFGRGAA